MEGTEQPSVVDRKKRVQRLKKMIIYGLLIGIIVPWILCIVLFVIVLGLGQAQKDSSREVNEKMAELTRLLETAREENQKWRDIFETRLLQSEEVQVECPPAVQEQEQVDSQVAKETQGDQKKEQASQEGIHKVYLTFDDGPSVHTNEILDILKAYDVKATFFVLGKEGEGSKQALKRIVAEGHTLAMHSYSHQYDSIYSSREAFAEDFQKIQDYIFQVTGVTSKIYRFPGGSSNTVTNIDIHEFIDYLEEQNTVYFDWNISSGDAAKISLSAETIADNATRGIENRQTSVILFHDAAGRESTVEALPIIIERILAMKDTAILPITEDTEVIQHVKSGD